MQDLLVKADQVFRENFEPTTWFERAIFLSWYCSKASCKFCYMSTQKEKSSIKSKRSLSSILAEAYLCKQLGWKIEFLSSGYNTHTIKELLDITSKIKEIYKEKLWLNIGPLGRNELDQLRPYVKGVCGSLETSNLELRKRLCPDKPLNDILEMFDNAIGFEKAITVIIGLGETLDDIPNLHRFIKNNNISKVIFYALNPHDKSIFKKGPDSFYYAEWIARTRIEFPNLYIVAGTWVNRVAEVGLLLRAGANAITKFPAIKFFNSEQARIIEEESENANRTFIGTLTDTKKLQEINIEDEKIEQYLRRMQKLKR